MQRSETAERPELNVIATFKAKPGMEQRVRETLEKMIAPTLREEANLGYALHQGSDDRTVFVLYEGWKSKDGLQRHMKQPYFEQMDRELKETLATPYEVTLVRAIGGKAPISV